MNKDKLDKIMVLLACPACRGNLTKKEKNFFCSVCQKEYPITEGRPRLIQSRGQGFVKESQDEIINRFKVFFKKYPVIFNFFFYVFGAVWTGKSPQKAVEDLGEERIILNLGSGVRQIRPDVINLDFFPFKNVDLVADVYRLPFKDNSADAIISEFMMEHLEDPQAAVSEMRRVLKPGGRVYLALPFVLPFHSSPDDYFRWSMGGLRKLMSGFREREIGVRSGPTSALLLVFNNWLAILFSFGSRKIYQLILMFLLIVTSPLKLIDLVVSKFPSAEVSALGFYYIGEK